MALISWGIFCILSAVVVVHLGWGFGMVWPAKSHAELGPMVVGTQAGVPMPSTALTLVVAAAIFGVALVAPWGAGAFSLGVLDGFKNWVLLAAIAVFGLRGVASYLPFGPLQASAAPFRTLDRRYFAPLCLLLAAGYLAIFLSL